MDVGWGGVMHFTFQTPGLGQQGPCSILCWFWVYGNSTFTSGDIPQGFPRAVLSSFLFLAVRILDNSSWVAPHLYLLRCCSQSPRANLFPVLTLSTSSAVVGVVCSSVDMGRTTGRVLPSSSSCIALRCDIQSGLCLILCKELAYVRWFNSSHSRR